MNAKTAGVVILSCLVLTTGVHAGGRTYKRSLGLYYGSVSLAGICYESSFDPQGANAMAYSIGSTGESDIDFAQQVRLYFFDGAFRPYAGLGLAEVLFYRDGAGILGNVTGGGGLDFEIFGKYNLGLELLFHSSIIYISLGGSRVYDSRLQPWFGAYFKREF